MARFELKSVPTALARLFVCAGVAWSAGDLGVCALQAAEYTLMPSPRP